LEVALPARDRGVDLIAYLDLESSVSKFVAAPIQMKAASTHAFSLDKKYLRIKNLIFAYVWGLQKPEHAVTCALTYHEALAVAEKMGWVNTGSWENGRYSTSAPSKKLRELLQPYKMSPMAWQQKVVGPSL
jgi:hypothetical protein